MHKDTNALVKRRVRSYRIKCIDKSTDLFQFKNSQQQILTPPKRAKKCTSLPSNKMITYVFSELYTPEWWRERFHNIECATGRLVQFTGTCWFNSIINIVLFSDIGILIKQIIDNNTFLKLKKISKRASFIDNFFSLAERILKTSNPVPINDGDISKILGNQLKKLMRTQKFENIKTTKTDIKTIKNKIKIIKNKIKPSRHQMEMLKLLNRRLEQLNIRLEQLNGNLEIMNELLEIYNNDKDCEYYNTKIEGGHSFLAFDECLEQVGIKFLNLEYENSDTIKHGTQVLIVPNKKTIKQSLEGYNLTASFIESDGHVVVGMVCNDIQYVFNSNNYISQMLWSDYVTKNTDFTITYFIYVLKEARS